MKTFETGGKKDTAGKLPLHLVPPEVVEIFAKVTQVGVDKGYAPRNWEKGLPINEGHLAAAERHMLRYKKGEDNNPEVLKDGTLSDAHHLEHAAWHLMAAAVQINRGRVDLDDRIDRPDSRSAEIEGYPPFLAPEELKKAEFRIRPPTTLDIRNMYAIAPDNFASFRGENFPWNTKEEYHLSLGLRGYETGVQFPTATPFQAQSMFYKGVTPDGIEPDTSGSF